MSAIKTSFQVDSKFLKVCATKWDELLLFKSNVVDTLVSRNDFTKSLEDPETFEQNRSAYIDVIRKFSKQRSDIIIEMYASHVSVEDPRDKMFNLVEGVESVSKRIDKVISKRSLVLKFRKGRKLTVHLKDVESVFLSDEKNISSIDYSKTILELPNFGKLKSSIDKTSKDDYSNRFNNKDYAKHFNDLKDLIEKPKIVNTSKSQNNNFFSQTLGFSIKSLTVSDILSAGFDTSTFEKKTANIDDIFANKNAYPEDLREFVKDKVKISGVRTTTFGKSLLYSFNTDNGVEIGKEYESGSFKILNEKSIEYKVDKSLNVYFNQNKYFTVCYFSTFSSKEKNTYFRSSYQSNHVLEVTENNDIFTVAVNLNESTTDNILDVKILKQSLFKENLKNYTHRVDGGSVSGQDKSKVKTFNKKLKEQTTDISSFINSATVNDGKINILVKFVKINDKYFLNKNFADVGNYHLFIPEVFLETLNSKVLLKKEVKSRSNVTDEVGNLTGEVYEIMYFIEIAKIYDNLRTTGKDSLRFLAPLYYSKWFYSPEINHKYENFKDGDRTVKYPVLEGKNILDWKYSSHEYETNGKIKSIENSIGPVRLIVNGKLVEVSGGPRGTNSGSKPLDQTKGDLKGPKEKALKISKNASSLENSKLNNGLDSATSGEDADFSLADLYVEVEKVKPKLDSIDLEFDFVKLNLIDAENPKGKSNSDDFKNISYENGRKNQDSNNLFSYRRSNIQPLLLHILNSALEITKKKYPMLESIVIHSSASPPPDLSSLIYYEKKISNLKLDDIKKSVNAAFGNGVGNFLTDKYINRVCAGYEERGVDKNHSLGLAADIYLKRRTQGNSLKYVCLYKPNDDFDFKILKYFLTTCKLLGATGLGAGMFYMDRPDYLRHLTDDDLKAMRKEPRQRIKARYNDLKIKTRESNSVSSTKKPIIIDENGIPIRISTASPSNAFHVDILMPAYVDYSNTQNFKTLASKMNLAAKTSEKATIKLKALLDLISKKSNSNRVWGEGGKSRTADRWLLDIIGGSKISSRPFNSTKNINSENFKKIAAQQFAATHKVEPPKAGTTIQTDSVSINDIREEND